MGPLQMLNEVKAHFDQGVELAASHVPALVEWATKAESDPLVQAAIGLVVPDATKAMLASLLKSVEADVAQVEAGARAEAAAAAQAAVDAAAAPPEPGTAPAEVAS